MSDHEHSDPQTYGPYRVEAKIGQGGMGSVYRGVHLKTGQHVAIKVLAGKMADQPRFRRRFAAEIETLEKLNHPNIVRLIGHGEKDGQLFYSMELVEGPSLLEYLRKVKRLDWDTTIGFAIEICGALKHAHDLGVIHRDLKPANLLIEPEGRIKLTDFGIAKLFGSSEQTAAGSVLGTADYMAPEQASSGAVTQRTDLYALGSLMYACLAGRPPFGGRNLTQVIHGLKHETPAPLDLVLPEVPPELAELIHELLEKDPADRPPTALVVGKRLSAMRVGLRRRSELTQIDMDGVTLPEADLESPVMHRQLAKDQADNVPRTAHGDFESQGNTPTQIEVVKTVASLPDASALLQPRRDVIHVPVDSRGQYSIEGDRFETAQEVSQAGVSRFEIVDEKVASRRLEPGEKGQRTSTWASIVFLAALLAAIGFGILWMVVPPTSENLLDSIGVAQSEGDEKRLETLREDFLRLYPEHEQSAAIRDALSGASIEERLRRFETLIGREKGELISHAAWLEAIQVRYRSTIASAQRLRVWLAVYDHPKNQRPDPVTVIRGSVSLDQLIELSHQLIDKFEANDSPVEDPRLTQLQAWKRWGETSLEGAERKQFEDALRELYGDKAWAESVYSSE